MDLQEKTKTHATGTTRGKNEGQMEFIQERSSLNPRISDLSRSATLVVNERSDALQRAGKGIYKYDLGQSPSPVQTEVEN